jgi:hypothetical protein
MNRLLQPLTLAALFTSGCANPPGHAAAPPMNVLTPTQLIATIDGHKGQSVTVDGYFTYVVDTRALWENEGAYLDAKQQRKGEGVDYWTKCITVYPSDGAVRQFNGHRVRVTGKATIFEKDDIRSFWTCNQVALEEAVITPD